MLFHAHIPCKTLIGAKSLCIRFDKVNGFIRVYDRTRYLELFGLEKYNDIYDRIGYLLGLKSDIAYVFSYKFGKIKIDSNDDLPLEEMLTLHNVIIITKSVFNKDQSHYYYNIFLEKCSYQLAKT